MQHPAPTLRTVTAERPPTLRSRATNGRTLFASGGDMRGPWARRLRDVFSLHVSDLGGAEMISTAEMSLARRAAVLTVQLEKLESKFSIGDDDDLDLYQRTVGNLRRLLESLGLQRRPRDVNGSPLQDYLRRYERTSNGAGDVVDVPAEQTNNGVVGDDG
jgi:hypothetical protein